LLKKTLRILDCSDGRILSKNASPRKNFYIMQEILDFRTDLPMDRKTLQATEAASLHCLEIQ